MLRTGNTRPGDAPMAQKTITSLVDDLDGGPADEAVRFALDSVEYEIDLSKTNAKTLREFLAYYIEHARRTSRRKR